MKRLKWNILPKQKVFPSTRCAEEKQQKYITVFTNVKRNTSKRQTEEITASHSPTL